MSNKAVNYLALRQSLLFSAIILEALGLGTVYQNFGLQTVITLDRFLVLEFMRRPGRLIFDRFVD